MKSLTRPVLALLLVCQIFTLSAFAEKNESPGIVTGKIIEKNSNKPVPYASVAVVHKETGEILTGVISDEHGNFKLSDLPYNAYELQVSYLGYKKRNLKVTIDKDHNLVEVGQIALESDAQKLDMVTVTEERLKGKQEVDRTVYTINDQVKRTSKDGTDVLKHIPGVSVDFQDNVTLEGTGNILYLVNGVARDQQFVAQLNPEDFNKVEIITNPGVEYDADIEAVISIVLKKAPTGGRGNIMVTMADPNKIASNQRGNLDYGNEKFRIFVSDRMNYQAYNAFSKKVTEVTHNGEQIDFSLKGDGDFKSLRNNLNYGLDLFLNDRNTLNLYGNTHSNLSRQNDFGEVGTQYVDGIMTDQYNLTTNLFDLGIGYYNSLFFKHDFAEKGHEITTQFDYYTFSSKADNTFDYEYTFLDSLLDIPIEISREENTRNHRQMIQSRNEYSRIINKMRWKIGYWSYYQWLDNEFTGGDDNTEFVFNELRQEAFLNAGGALGKIRYNMGLRYAYSKSRIDRTASNVYHSFLPQISLMYGIKKGHSLKLSVRRRIVRPNMNQLNPFEVRMDSSSINVGNPELDPQIVNRAELQYGINLKKNYFAPKLFFEHSNNSIQSLLSVDNDGNTVTRPENIGKQFMYGLSLNTSMKLAWWFKLNANARIYNTNVSGPGNYDDELWTKAINGNAMFTPWKERKISFSAMLQYSSDRLGYKSIQSRDILFLVGGDVFIKEKLKISAAINPLSQKFKYSGTERTDTNYYYLQEGRVDVSQLFMFMISYNFQWGKTPKKIERATDYEGENGGGIF